MPPLTSDRPDAAQARLADGAYVDLEHVPAAAFVRLTPFFPEAR